MLRKFKDKHTGETCLIVGNGPSLKDAPLELLSKYPSFGANRVFLLEGFVPTYYTVIDEHMLHDCAEAWSGENGFAPEAMFIRHPYPVPGSYQIRCEVAVGFSLDPAKEIFMGGTVTFANLQLAHYMGFKTVLLVGVDHHYPGMNGTRNHFPFVAKGNDIDHFHPDYFSKGKIYAAPELEATEIFYTLARKVYEKDGRKIINLTPGTKLNALEKQTYKDWLK